MLRFLLALLVVVPCCSFASDPVDELPADVVTFIERRDLCDHFRGEEPYDEERRSFLEKNIIEYCTGTDRRLANLRQKYKQNPVVMDLLSGYEEVIEPTK